MGIYLAACQIYRQFQIEGVALIFVNCNLADALSVLKGNGYLQNKLVFGRNAILVDQSVERNSSLYPSVELGGLECKSLTIRCINLTFK